MIMGGVNMKLMKGIDDAENQLQKEKQTPKIEEAMRKETGTENNKGTVRNPQKSEKQPRAKKTSMRKKAVIEPDKMSKKQVFSFRAVLTDIAIWKAYAIATGQTVESIGNNAMNEYLKKHKLSGAERVIFDAVKARDSNSSK
jgi:hypothetical protein